MKFSIIIPAKNVEKYLAVCFNSLLDQTIDKKEFEVILVDDCSSDETLALAKKLGAELGSLTVLERGSSEGPGIARNDGLNVARGEYVLFVDADDYLERTSLEFLSQSVSFNPVDMLAFNSALVRTPHEEPYAYRKDLAILSSDPFERMCAFLRGDLDGSVIFTMFRRLLIEDEQLRFPSGLHEDISFIFRMYCSARVVNKTSKVLYNKVAMDSSIVHTFGKAHVDGVIQAAIENYEYAIRSGLGSKDELYPYFLRGFIGNVAGLLQRNILFNGDDREKRKSVYADIHQWVFKTLDFRSFQYQIETKKDRHFSRFLHATQEGGISDLTIKQFEEGANDEGLLDFDNWFGKELS